MPKSSTVRPRTVRWSHERDPAKPLAARADWRGEGLERLDGPVSSADHGLAEPAGRSGKRPGGPKPGNPAQRGQALAQLSTLRPPGRLSFLVAHHRLQSHG